jgi:Icc-related predicted phosphoesterase
MHGNLRPVRELMAPEMLICCGDWGDPGQVAAEEYDDLLSASYVVSVYGNHDDLELLSALRNRDGTRVLLENGRVTDALGVRIAGISGIWAKSHAKRWYITDEEVLAAAEMAAGAGVELLITHGCAIGLNDALPGGRRGGQRCFLDAFKAAAPQVYLCGHLHVQQVKTLKDGRLAANVGNTALGDYLVLERTEGRWKASADRLQADW